MSLESRLRRLRNEYSHTANVITHDNMTPHLVELKSMRRLSNLSKTSSCSVNSPAGSVRYNDTFRSTFEIGHIDVDLKPKFSTINHESLHEIRMPHRRA